MSQLGWHAVWLVAACILASDIAKTRGSREASHLPVALPLPLPLRSNLSGNALVGSVPPSWLADSAWPVLGFM